MIDVTTIHVKAGDGGNGVVSFRREKYIPKGGPDGGDGGFGGSVFLVGESNLRTLDFFSGKERFKAEFGGHGRKQNMHGKKGESLELKVPLGTVVWEIQKENSKEKNEKILEPKLEGEKLSRGRVFEVWKALREQVRNDGDEVTKGYECVSRVDGLRKFGMRVLVEVTEQGKKVKIARGGKGGRGNFFFRSASNRVPREAEPGEPGEERWLVLELKLLADVGLVGLPNAGKSTLLSVLTEARPKIADYPFTTLEPNLGVMRLNVKSKNQKAKKMGLRRIYGELVIADLPGLIEGASQGKGLGQEFLRHVERCRLLVHVVGINDKISMQSGSSQVARSDRDDPVALNSLASGSNSGIEEILRDYQTIRKELEEYHPSLTRKSEVVVVNKTDLISSSQIEKIKMQIEKKFEERGVTELMFVSAATGEGIEELKQKLMKL